MPTGRSGKLKTARKEKKANQLKQIFESANDSRKKLGIMLQKLKQDMLLLQKQSDELVNEIQQCGLRVQGGFEELEQYAQEGKRLKSFRIKLPALLRALKRYCFRRSRLKKSLRK